MFSPVKRLWIAAAVMLAAAAPVGGIAAGTCPRVGFARVEAHATSETRALKDSQHRTVFVHRQWLTTTRDIAEIKVPRPRDGDDDDVDIQIKLIPAADRRLHQATTNHSGMRFAFLFNDEILNNVVWQGPYGTYLGGIQVSIRHGRTEAEKLMKGIAGCTAAALTDGAQSGPVDPPRSRGI